MISCIDIGNTNVKMGLFEDNTLVDVLNVKHSEASEAVSNIFSTHSIKQTVLADVSNNAEKILGKIPTPVYRIHSSIKFPINSEYQTPDTLGVDRILGAVAANARYPNMAVLVIDIGTCATYDLVENGVYKGGAIAPGLQMRLNAMHFGTGNLPLVKFSEQFVTIGTSTKSSVLMGAATAMVCEIDGMIERFKSQRENLIVMLTGGDASFFERHVKNAIFAAPNLIFEGMYGVYKHNALEFND